MTGTVRLHRVLACPPGKVYRAFLEADAYSAWLPPNGFTATVDHLEPRVGAGFHMSFRNFTTGLGHSFGGTYLALKKDRRISYSTRFDDPNLPGEMTVTVDLKPVSCGTDVSIVQAGIPAMIPEDACYLGWQESLAKLARLVEPNIQG